VARLSRKIRYRTFVRYVSSERLNNVSEPRAFHTSNTAWRSRELFSHGFINPHVPGHLMDTANDGRPTRPLFGPTRGQYKNIADLFVRRMPNGGWQRNGTRLHVKMARSDCHETTKFPPPSYSATTGGDYTIIFISPSSVKNPRCVIPICSNMKAIFVVNTGKSEIPSENLSGFSSTRPHIVTPHARGITRKNFPSAVQSVLR